MGKIIHENGLGGLHAQGLQRNMEDARIGFHHAHFGGDNDRIESISHVPFVINGSSYVAECVADYPGFITTMQAADVID